jgi:hypothetical protein
MTLRNNWVKAAVVIGCAGIVGCAQEPPRRPLDYGTSGNRPPQAVAAREPLYETSLGAGTISGSAGAATTRPAAASMPTGADLPMSPAVGASGAPVTPGTPGPAAPGAGSVAVPPPADAGTAAPAPADAGAAAPAPAAPASNP